MKNEVNDTMMMAVTITMISIIVVIIGFTIYQGKTIGNMGVVLMDKVLTDTTSGTFRELDGQVTEMPVASIYSLINGIGDKVVDRATSSTTIVKYKSGAYTHLKLADNITGKALVEVHKLPSGLYRVILHSTNCTIDDSGVCNCTAESTLKSYVISHGYSWE